MLAVVKTPHIEISVSGEGAEEALAWLSKKFDVTILALEGPAPDTVRIEDTDFWREMQRNRIGNLMEAARLKAGFSQKELAEKAGIKQNMISEYENGRRRLTKRMAEKIARALNVKPERFLVTSPA